MADSAQAKKVTNTCLCPICLEKFNSPRSLPCKHSFCEKCLFTFVFNLKEKGEIDTCFECPVCRIPCEMNKSCEVTLEWIQTFPLCSDLMKNGQNQFDLKNDKEKQKCASCQEEEMKVSCKKYCLDCRGFLCEDCVTAHNRYNALKKHKLLNCDDIDRSHEVFEKIKMSSMCTKHPVYDIELYCAFHEELMCLVCAATSHKECKNIVILADCTSHNEEKILELKARMDGAEKHLDSLKKISENNCDEIRAKVNSYRKELHQMKDFIIKRMNEIVDNEHSLTKQIIIDAEDKSFAYTQNIEKLKALYKMKLSFLHSLVQSVRPKEIFVCVERLTTEIDELETQIYSAESDIKVADVGLKLIDFFTSICAKLVEKQIPLSKIQFHSPINLPTLKLPFTIVSSDSNRIRLNDKCRPRYTSIAVQEDGSLLLCDSCILSNSCGYIAQYEVQNKRKQTLKLDRPYCATPISDSLVAVTMPSSKSIKIVSMGLPMKKDLPTKQIPKGIVALKNGKVAISWSDPQAFSISDIGGLEIKHVDYFTEDITGRKFKTFNHLAINEKKRCVIQPCTEDKAVYCFTFKRQPVFKYENNLQYPKGVAVDPKSGCVFVCDYLDDCIHQISSTGRPMSVTKHALVTPLSVCFDDKRQCLWVSSNNSNQQSYIKCLNC